MSRKQVPAAGWMRPTAIAAGHRHEDVKIDVPAKEVAT